METNTNKPLTVGRILCRWSSASWRRPVVCERFAEVWKPAEASWIILEWNPLQPNPTCRMPISAWFARQISGTSPQSGRLRCGKPSDIAPRWWHFWSGIFSSIGIYCNGWINHSQNRRSRIYFNQSSLFRTADLQQRRATFDWCEIDENEGA